MGLCLRDHIERVVLVLVVPMGPRSPVGLQLSIEPEDVLSADVPRQPSQYRNRGESCTKQILCVMVGGGIECPRGFDLYFRSLLDFLFDGLLLLWLKVRR